MSIKIIVLLFDCIIRETVIRSLKSGDTAEDSNRPMITDLLFILILFYKVLIQKLF